jgi:hypothetical protein
MLLAGASMAVHAILLFGVFLSLIFSVEPQVSLLPIIEGSMTTFGELNRNYVYEGV